MAWLRRKNPMGSAGSDVLARMPRATQPTRTEQYAEQARQHRPADEHWTQTHVFSYLELLRGRYDLPLYVGVIGRPAILLCMSTQLRKDLGGLGELIQRKGANLYLAGHRAGRHGMMRAVLELPEYDLIFEAILTLTDSDVQEFLSAAYRNETIELHLAHVNDPRPLRFTSHAAGIRPVVDAVLDAVHGLDHPRTPSEHAAATSELEARFPKLSDGLSGRTRIRLTVTGTPDGVVTVLTRN